VPSLNAAGGAEAAPRPRRRFVVWTFANRTNTKSAILVAPDSAGDLPKRVHELDSSREIVAHCKMGGRSAKAVDFLRQAGFKKVWNLAGGINAWAEKVDPKVRSIAVHCPDGGRGTRL